MTDERHRDPSAAAEAPQSREPAVSGEAEPTSDEAIRALVARLSRPHRDGGRVVERATLLAEGSDFEAVVAWIVANGGEPEAPATRGAQGGLHSARSSAVARDATPLRFILPAAATDS